MRGHYKNLNEMSLPRKSFIANISNYSKTTFEHLLKIVVYGKESRDFNKWIKEIANYLFIVNTMTLKPHNKKATENEYRKYLTYEVEDKWNDIRIQLYFFNKRGEYPEFEITDNLITDLFNYYSNFLDKYCKILASYNNYEMPDFERMLVDDYNKFFKNSL